MLHQKFDKMQSFVIMQEMLISEETWCESHHLSDAKDRLLQRHSSPLTHKARSAFLNGCLQPLYFRKLDHD